MGAMGAVRLPKILVLTIDGFSVGAALVVGLQRAATRAKRA